LNVIKRYKEEKNMGGMFSKCCGINMKKNEKNPKTNNMGDGVSQKTLEFAREMVNNSIQETTENRTVEQALEPSKEVQELSDKIKYNNMTRQECETYLKNVKNELLNNRIGEKNI